MQRQRNVRRTFRASVTAALLLLLGACSNADAGGGRPDLTQVRQRLADNASAQTEGHARLVDFKEKRCEKTDEMGGASNWIVEVEGVMEIDAPCYYLNRDRAKGDRVKFEFSTNFIHDDKGKWIQEPGRIDEL